MHFNFLSCRSSSWGQDDVGTNAEANVLGAGGIFGAIATEQHVKDPGRVHLRFGHHKTEPKGTPWEE